MLLALLIAHSGEEVEVYFEEKHIVSPRAWIFRKIFGKSVLRKTKLGASKRSGAGLAQLVEQLICNQWVGSSSLSTGTIFPHILPRVGSRYLEQSVCRWSLSIFALRRGGGS